MLAERNHHSVHTLKYYKKAFLTANSFVRIDGANYIRDPATQLSKIGRGRCLRLHLIGNIHWPVLGLGGMDDQDNTSSVG